MLYSLERIGVRRKIFQGGQHRHFAYPFQASVQTNVHKTLKVPSPNFQEGTIPVLPPMRTAMLE